MLCLSVRASVDQVDVINLVNSQLTAECFQSTVSFMCFLLLKLTSFFKKSAFSASFLFQFCVENVACMLKDAIRCDSHLCCFRSGRLC